MLFPSNHIISSETEYKVYSDVRVGVFAHLYYEESIPVFARYLAKIPDSIDVYVSASKKKVFDLCRENIKRNIVYIECENRGRDVAALLVAIKPYIISYKYFCFVHDKKEKKALYRDMTQKWVNGLWDNMLHDACYINSLITLFEENEKSGLLLPPFPLHPLNNQMLFNYWEKNYPNVVDLAKKLGLLMPIEIEKCVLSLGTMFWAKRDVLKKLFDFPWTYSDFPLEPLPNDGAISHAIERILSFVAEDAGYSVSYVMTEEYASTYINDMHNVIIDAFSVLNKKYNISSYYQLQQMIGGAKDVIEFARNHDRIYIYGAGEYGKRCKAILDYYDVQTNGFLVSDDVKMKELSKVPIQKLNSFRIGNNDGVIVAVSEKYRKEIIENLKNMEIKNIAIYSSIPD